MVKSAEQDPMPPSMTGGDFGSGAAGVCALAASDRVRAKRMDDRARVAGFFMGILRLRQVRKDVVVSARVGVVGPELFAIFFRALLR